VAEGRRLLNQRLRAEFVAGAEEDSHHGSGVAWLARSWSACSAAIPETS